MCVFPFVRAWRAYLSALEKHQLSTMACSTGALMCAGDIISQVAIEKKGFNRGQKYDVTRSLRFLGFGIVLAGPVFRTWYWMLDKTFRMARFGNLKMVFFDQVVFAPSFFLYLFISMAAMKGESMYEIKDKINKDYFDVMYANYQVWPLVQACNFTFVPVQHRVLVVNLVSLGWNTYLAWKTEHKLNHKEVSH
ncbi:hypothetical protein CHS0354_035602 [Potamilus streckersoni]|uniref:Mitochondrial inner membrane protein Mpv17 n=1 Tax=Potamilus streckersoni TaxID=2493646 RepID=A0AAE0VI19_9BIVA|nr:hypothetical protein CHS0354_035602 [Potamilus streckersoni]